MKCYLSGEILSDQNLSEEHIIQDFMGGRLKSSLLMTKDWNVKLGQTIDSELSKQIRLSDLMNLKRRNKARKLTGITRDSQNYFIHPGGKTGEVYPREPKQIIDENGKNWLEIKGDKAIKDYVKSLRRKFPDLGEDELAEMYLERPPSFEDKVVYSDLFKPISGSESFRAIAKIAANFYVYCTKDIQYVKPIAEFIKKGLGRNSKLFPYYAVDIKKLNLPKNELFHLIYMHGVAESKILYCYIELFNVHNYIVILNNNYRGNDFECFYRQNLHTGRFDFEKFKVPIYVDDIRRVRESDIKKFVPEYKKRIEYFLKVNNIRVAGFLKKDELDSNSEQIGKDSK